MLNSTKKKVLHGSAANLLQMLLSFSVSLVAPPFLVHHMQPAEYSAWVLILQISAYINYLEVGIQTAIGKFVAEYQAAGDTPASARLVSTAFSMLAIAGVLGLIAMGAIALQMAVLFRSVPSALLPAMRIGVLAIGGTAAIALPFLVLQAIFVGLQRYAIPTVIASVGRIGSAAGIILLLSLHGTLTQMALLIGLFNLLNMGAQWMCWRRYARAQVPLHLFAFDRGVARQLLAYCGVLAVWTLGSFLISGLDTTIVGRYDFRNTGFYAIASSASNFMLLIVGNALGPLMPAVSSLHAQRTPQQLGALLVRVTRYCTLLLLVLALPLLVGGFPLLRLWVGPLYASGSVQILSVLVIANVIRQLGYPYALVVVATGSQRRATISPVTEAVVNLACSLLLVRSVGAIGVAGGTLIGAVAGLLIHLLVSMRWTRPVVCFSRLCLLLQGVARPAMCAVPTLLVLPWFHANDLLPLPPALLAAWLLSTAALAWRGGLTHGERHDAVSRVRALVY